MHHHWSGRRVSRQPSVEGRRSTSSRSGCRHGWRRTVRRPHCGRAGRTSVDGCAGSDCCTCTGGCAAGETSRRDSSPCAGSREDRAGSREQRAGSGEDRAGSSAKHACADRTAASCNCRFTSNRHAADDSRQQGESAEARSTRCSGTGPSACSTGTAFRRSRCRARLCPRPPDGELAEQREGTRRG